MKINDDFIIESEPLNVILKERYFPEVVDEATGEKVLSTEPKWKVVGYYSNPKQALKGLVTHKIMSDGMKDYESIVETLDSLEDMIENLTI